MNHRQVIRSSYVFLRSLATFHIFQQITSQIPLVWEKLPTTNDLPCDACMFFMPSLRLPHIVEHSAENINLRLWMIYLLACHHTLVSNVNHSSASWRPRWNVRPPRPHVLKPMHTHALLWLHYFIASLSGTFAQATKMHASNSLHLQWQCARWSWMNGVFYGLHVCPCDFPLKECLLMTLLIELMYNVVHRVTMIMCYAIISRHQLASVAKCETSRVGINVSRSASPFRCAIVPKKHRTKFKGFTELLKLINTNNFSLVR